MSNFIAAWGPCGPMYLKKTKNPKAYYVLNGEWELFINLNDPKTSKYFIVKDDFIDTDYTTACELIREIYDEDDYGEYDSLHPTNHKPYNPIDENESIGDLTGLKGVTQEMLYNLPSNNIESSIKDTTTPIEDVTTTEMYAIAEHLNIPQPLTAINKSVIKQLIAQGYKPTNKEKPMSPTTDVVTVETVHLVNGIDVTELNPNELLDSLIQLEANIKKLTEIETSSDFIKTTILKQKDALATVVKHLDSKG